MGSIAGSRRSPGGEHGNSLQYSCWGNPWTEAPTSYSPWGHKELDMTEQLSTHTHTRAVSNSNHAEKSKCFHEPNMTFSLSVCNVIIFIY